MLNKGKHSGNFDRYCERRREALLEVFRQACHPEAAFWEQGLVLGQ